MTDYQQHLKNNPRMRAALKQAYHFAKSGSRNMTQHWINRASSFADVPKFRVSYLQRILDKAIATKRATDLDLCGLDSANDSIFAPGMTKKAEEALRDNF